MSNNEYPEELYNIWCKNTTYAEDMERAYDVGFERGVNNAKQANNGDWHNLTEAIKAGEPIDFEKLDGRKAKCVSSNGVTVTYKLERDPAYSLEVFEGWYTSDSARAWEASLEDSWNGEPGWTLYLDGEIPMKKQTADELPFGTEFVDTEGVHWVKVMDGQAQRRDNKFFARVKGLEVSEVIGMYGQKESE